MASSFSSNVYHRLYTYFLILKPRIHSVFLALYIHCRVFKCIFAFVYEWISVFAFSSIQNTCDVNKCECPTDMVVVSWKCGHFLPEYCTLSCFCCKPNLFILCLRSWRWFLLDCCRMILPVVICHSWCYTSPPTASSHFACMICWRSAPDLSAILSLQTYWYDSCDQVIFGNCAAALSMSEMVANTS